MLRTKGVYEFANNCTVSVNGNKVDAKNVVKNEEEIFAVAIKTVTVYRDADYTAVDSELEKVKALNKDEYKDFSAVEAAVNAVVRGKKITEQAEVDKMAQAIRDAVAALEKNPVDSKGSGTGDTGSAVMLITVMLVFGVLAAVLKKKKRTE